MQKKSRMTHGATTHPLQARRPLSAARLNSIRAWSTLVMIWGFAVAAALASAMSDVDDLFRMSAIIVGGSLFVGYVLEAQGGVRNLIRTDLFMLAVLYLLTFLEFLFPQNSLERSITIEGGKLAVFAVLIGFGGIVIGRHAVRMRVPCLETMSARDIRPKAMIAILLFCFVIGYLHIFLAVKFNPIEMLRQMTDVRFSQSWSRGRYGSISTLLNELGLFIYLIPPLAGAIIGQGQKFSGQQKLITIGILLFTLFHAFSGGTRNIFLTHMITFSVSFALVQPKLTWGKIAKIGIPALAIISAATYYMLAFRKVGLLNLGTETKVENVFIDMNIVNIAKITQIFPNLYSYLGAEIPYTAFIRPIPRALWEGKPEGLSITIEEALGAYGYTLAATFVGEFYMAGGFLAIAVAALFFGAIASIWNRVGADARSNGELILFASGFFAAGICMRSFLSVFPTLLPTIALWFLIKKRRQSSRFG